MADRYFDELSGHFAKKIYGGAKGAIRLATLQADLQDVLPKRSLRVLDVGAGLGHMSLYLAKQGHDVTVTEPSALMLEGARESFADENVTATFIQKSWQSLSFEYEFDLVLCHAVLEWLEEPLSILPFLKSAVRPEGWLSLAFYNKDALIYYNLLKGNLRKVKKAQFAGEKQSLTPQNPIDPLMLKAVMEQTWTLHTCSGVRVFYDYMPPHFRKDISLDDIIEMELKWHKHPSYVGVGRYLHWLCQPA